MGVAGTEGTVSPVLIRVVVVGAHLVGQPLHHQLTDRGATLVDRTTTAPRYRLYALAGTTPPKPGLRRVASGGAAIEVEVWELPAEGFGTFVAAVPPPLGIGKIELADGRWECGFICEEHGFVDATDITHLGGWRAFLEGGAVGT